MTKKSSGKNKSILAKEVVKYADLLMDGLVYSLDPSSGSGKSLPGFAYFYKGKLLQSGQIKIPPGTRNYTQRLFLMRQELNTLPPPHLVVTESIGTGFGSGLTSKPLLHSVGVIVSQWNVPVLEVSPATWKSLIDKDRYVKSDAQDAVTLYCAARRILEREMNLAYETPMIYLEGELKNV